MHAHIDPTPRRMPRNGWLLLTVLFAFSGITTHAQTAMEDRLAACASCHGTYGEGAPGNEYYPHLAGKPAGYLYEQLRGFRDGRRVNTQMAWLVQFMDDDYMHQIADFYAAQPPVSQAAAGRVERLSPTQRARAQALVTQGDAQRDIPACTACHGDNLAGLEPGIPALVGLPADYISAQLGSWLNGIRRAPEPDCMAIIARRMDPEMIRLVAHWLANQSPDQGAPPAPAGSLALPMQCSDLPAETEASQ